jgi:hypothetical protein
MATAKDLRTPWTVFKSIPTQASEPHNSRKMIHCLEMSFSTTKFISFILQRVHGVVGAKQQPDDRTSGAAEEDHGVAAEDREAVVRLLPRLGGHLHELADRHQVPGVVPKGKEDHG